MSRSAASLAIGAARRHRRRSQPRLSTREWRGGVVKLEVDWARATMPAETRRRALPRLPARRRGIACLTECDSSIDCLPDHYCDSTGANRASTRARAGPTTASARPRIRTASTACAATPNAKASASRATRPARRASARSSPTAASRPAIATNAPVTARLRRLLRRHRGQDPASTREARIARSRACDPPSNQATEARVATALVLAPFPSRWSVRLICGVTECNGDCAADSDCAAGAFCRGGVCTRRSRRRHVLASVGVLERLLRRRRVLRCALRRPVRGLQRFRQRR